MNNDALLQVFADVPGFGASIGLVLALAVSMIVLKAMLPRRGAPSLQRTLRAIRRAPLRAVPVLNQSERKLHQHLSRIVGQSHSHSLLAQVSMGEFLRVDGKRVSRSQWQTVFNAFNSRRVDFLIVDADFQPCLAIEYQGSGHFQGNARARDAIKRAIYERAGIALMEVAASGLTSAQARDVQAMVQSRQGTAAA